MRAHLLLICLTFALTSIPTFHDEVKAGARPVKIVLAWVSPDAGSAGQCHSQIGSVLLKGETSINYTSRAAITGRVGLTSKTFEEAWFDLPDERFVEGLKNIRGIKSETEDAVVMVSCDPKKRLIKAVVLAQGKSVLRFRAEHIDFTRPLLTSLGQGLRDSAMVGFVP